MHEGHRLGCLRPTNVQRRVYLLDGSRSSRFWLLVAYPRLHSASPLPKEHLFRQFQHGYRRPVLVLSLWFVLYPYSMFRMVADHVFMQL